MTPALLSNRGWTMNKPDEIDAEVEKLLGCPDSTVTGPSAEAEVIAGPWNAEEAPAAEQGASAQDRGQRFMTAQDMLRWAADKLDEPPPDGMPTYVAERVVVVFQDANERGPVVVYGCKNRYEVLGVLADAITQGSIG
jgi:hypothetical protein